MGMACSSKQTVNQQLKNEEISTLHSISPNIQNLCNEELPKLEFEESTETERTLPQDSANHPTHTETAPADLPVPAHPAMVILGSIQKSLQRLPELAVLEPELDETLTKTASVVRIDLAGVEVFSFEDVGQIFVQRPRAALPTVHALKSVVLPADRPAKRRVKAIIPRTAVPTDALDELELGQGLEVQAGAAVGAPKFEQELRVSVGQEFDL
ncbi:hypothetical protein SS50377_28577 [Spironucleus salmonicida]|uniref:Uncharacterized protein n=1 Tax=Spironucleus salmonicida TaxID=348837 RepID=V6LBH2_9EUKA|nr:hypothetical protein SS50377_28577 [Spironucleus salmonicida]|eukprot:EST41598.1 Hypothetical protein SS50377_18940 [Spironucleus salmonicida]